MIATPTSWPVVASEGAAIGGEGFDAMLFDAKLSKPLGLVESYRLGMGGKHLSVPVTLRRMRTLNGILAMSTEGRVKAILENWGDELPVVYDIIDGGHSWEFYKAIESAKIALSEQAKTTIRFARPSTRIAIHESVSRAEFERLIARDLGVIDATISRALGKAGLDEEGIDLVARTGGSSQIPAFIELLTRRFGHHKVEERDAFNTVALGLGLKAFELWEER
jgi:hypothetical chaperone protein